MINFTLTITAAPELLEALSTFTNSITAAKVITIPETNSEFKANAYQLQNSSAQKTLEAQQPVQIQVPGSVTSIYNEPQQQAPVLTQPAQVPAVPTSAQSYTMEQLAVAATQIVDAGRRTELVGLLNSFGVQALTALPKEQYGAFATQLRALGAKL